MARESGIALRSILVSLRVPNYSHPDPFEALLTVHSAYLAGAEWIEWPDRWCGTAAPAGLYPCARWHLRIVLPLVKDADAQYIPLSGGEMGGTDSGA